MFPQQVRRRLVITLAGAALIAGPAAAAPGDGAGGATGCRNAPCSTVCRCLFDRFEPDRRLRYGYGMTGDPASAAYWYGRAAAAGDVRATYNLALMMLRGDGVAADPEGAARLLGEAAGRGLAEAGHALATLHRLGRGVPRDLRAAFRLYRKGAVRGHTPSQHALANLHADGRGTAPDLVAAWVWWSRASRRGHLLAREALPRAEMLMTRSELTRARRRLAAIADAPDRR